MSEGIQNDVQFILQSLKCVCVCVCVCVRERVYVDRLYFKLAASHSRGNLNNAEDVRAYIFNVWLCHAFYFIDCYVLTSIICHK